MSETAPLTGHTSRTMPAAMASTAEMSAHQNPGACRAMKVVIRPTMPLIEQQPADEDRDRERRDHRDQDGQDAEHDQHDALDQEQDPMLANRLRERALQLD